ncbi:2-amino-4-hydroxy-6-hydroxymethyldihydropteridine diphosphokinase [Pseudidiomarina tainanensis]|jgi:2-amino-4-hydroxy-6-hydroxymethyldihydropteridine diphosphokinase|uniref:2-amino-4-hydroxy-6-hydroxymethyldihydropteridine pyrophosphokinase n=2 Tax=Pseudidiomarina TaxID=2800384 RepID=A0A1I6HYB7_9GAMM|nr:MULTISPECIES: 2-amino-4-hydroxy-6-hydroxymethyldihydropteridine diphosphokinase [Pseudidiomarina]RZQ55261.1 2-amino-4-hydroxy-6-hydroxymethyldihydropteridine diphosphokinase [Pseudidiomarina tainanensis]SFR59441.1 2-amino-4-hydroxy-6-hydroxymethyldihydropteridinediphosphokinase [Pseudidiomarina maritima]
MATAYIALGANLGDPVQTLKDAILHLSGLPQLQFLRSSSLYSSTPMGPSDQPDYVNAVCCTETDLAPLELLDLLQTVENQFGRQRIRHWGPRTLDLDLLLYDDQVINEPRLCVPHPGMTERDFVLIPLAELAPELNLPNGRSVASLLIDMTHHDLKKIT